MSAASVQKVTGRILKETLSFSASPLPQGLTFSVSPLHRESLADDSLKTLPAAQRKQAWRQTAATVGTQQQTHTCAGCTKFASVILWVMKWSSGDGSGTWKVEVIIFQGDSYELCSFDTRDISGGVTIKTTQRGGRGKQWFTTALYGVTAVYLMVSILC